jgi:hypothetical protein
VKPEDVDFLAHLDAVIAAYHRGEASREDMFHAQELIKRRREAAQAEIEESVERQVEMLKTIPALRREVHRQNPQTRGLPPERIARMHGLVLERRPDRRRPVALPRIAQRPVRVSARPREHGNGRVRSRRGPPSDDPSGDVDPPLNRCKQQAEELTPEQLDDLSTFARIRAKWLRTGRRWST